MLNLISNIRTSRLNNQNSEIGFNELVKENNRLRISSIKKIELKLIEQIFNIVLIKSIYSI